MTIRLVYPYGIEDIIKVDLSRRQLSIAGVNEVRSNSGSVLQNIAQWSMPSI